MAIGGKEFKIDYEDHYPSLKIDIIIGSPNPAISQTRKIEKVLIDTGSDFTLIPNGIIKRLRLLRTGTIKEIEGFNGDTLNVIFYSAKIFIDEIMDGIFEVGGIDNEPIIGMDLINKWHLLLNCPNGTFEIVNGVNYKPPS